MYTNFYGFSEKPFEVTPDLRFLYLTPSHRQTIAAVIDGITDGRGYISVTGEVGTGKTTLIRFLLHELDAREKVKTVLLFNPSITFDDLLKSILLDLGLKVVKSGRKDLFHQLNEYLSQMIARHEALVVIIDEAQGLLKDVLKELGMLPELKGFQIILVGQPELEGALSLQDLSQLQRRITNKCQVRALTGQDSMEYIDHRLRLVGSSASQRFTPKALSMISSYARGIPRILNILCDNAFLIGYSLSQERIDVDIVREVINNIEDPSSQKTILSPINTALKQFCISGLGLRFSPRRACLAILFLFCLGGVVFLIEGNLQRTLIQAWNLMSSKRAHVDTRAFSASPSPQKANEGNLPFVSAYSASESDKLKEVVTVKEGDTLSLLTRKYYSRTNPAFLALILDFNPEITDANLIVINHKIKIPKITEELLIMQSDDHTYAIHVGTFENTSFVRFYTHEPALKGKHVETFPRKVSPKGTWYRVMVGPFAHKDECLKVIDQLKEKGLLPIFGGILKTE
jgi:general secretion pathway protein A